jgi:hypothetical protein
MAKIILLTVDEKKYTLEYCREGIRIAEKCGMEWSGEINSPITTTTALFYGALAKHHPRITRAQSDELYEKCFSAELMQELAGMAGDVINTLFDSTKKKAEWTVVET